MTHQFRKVNPRCVMKRSSTDRQKTIYSRRQTQHRREGVRIAVATHDITRLQARRRMTSTTCKSGLKTSTKTKPYQFHPDICAVYSPCVQYTPHLRLVSSFQQSSPPCKLLHLSYVYRPTAIYIYNIVGQSSLTS